MVYFFFFILFLFLLYFPSFIPLLPLFSFSLSSLFISFSSRSSPFSLLCSFFIFLSVIYIIFFLCLSSLLSFSYSNFHMFLSCCCILHPLLIILIVDLINMDDKYLKETHRYEFYTIYHTYSFKFQVAKVKEIAKSF